MKPASHIWSMLDGKRASLLQRCQRYAALTLPTVLLEEGLDLESIQLGHDYQSLGAQAANHVTNKLMLALFRPSKPFFKVDLDDKTIKEAQKVGTDQPTLSAILSQGEIKAAKRIDKLQQRPKLYQCIRHLVVVGNVLLYLGKDSIRVMGLRYYCVKRDQEGRVHTLVIRERVCYDELEDSVKAAVPGRFNGDALVDHYKLIVRHGKDYHMTQWVNNNQLPKEFNGKWSEEDLPYRVLAWNLADEANYGTGLVEDYVGDLEAASALAEAVVTGSVQGTEFRWMVNPTGMTSVTDFQNSRNGDALAGLKDDIAAVNNANVQGVTMAHEAGSTYEQRISRGFLMGSAVTRQAERVTAEEVRLTANELETAYGGVYSTLAATMQLPVARWCLDQVDFNIKGTRLEITIVTGLDALSRNGELENLRGAINDLAQFNNLPPSLQDRMEFQPLALKIGEGWGVDLSPYLKSEEAYQALLQQRAEQQVAVSNATAAGEAAAKSGATSE